MTRLILVRHPPVAKAWSGRCYGRSDMSLSRMGQAMLGPMAERLAALRPDTIVHSGMRRTSGLADLLMRRTGLCPIEDHRWRERDFGAWEGRTWNAIHRETGSAMDGMIDAPASFRPGGDGETTCAMIERVSCALAALPVYDRVVVVTHGGPIAALRCLIEGTPLTHIAHGIIPPATFVAVDLRSFRSAESEAMRES